MEKLIVKRVVIGNCVLLLLLALLFPGTSLAETCTLQTYASSWMATGTPFSVKCPSGVYKGVLVATPARSWFRRGHLILKFDQPVALMPKRPGQEAKIQPGRGRIIASMLVNGGVGIGAKDLTDGISGAIFRSWYMIPISFVALGFFSHGGNVNLKPGYKLQIERINEPAGASLLSPNEGVSSQK